MRGLLFCLVVLAPVCATAGQYEIINPVYRVPPQQQPPAPPAGNGTPPRIDTAQPCAKPDYPAPSLAGREEGTVELQLLIDADSHVADSRIVRSSGHSALDEAARAALMSCRYMPGTVDGKAERQWMTIRYHWTLPQ